MDRAEAALLARLHEAQGRLYAGGDERPVRDLLTPDVAWRVPGDNAIAGNYHGINQVMSYFRRRRDLAGATMRMSARELLVGPGQHVASITDGTATLGGVERSWSTVGLYRVSGDRIAECWLLPLDPAAFDDAWRGVR